MWTVLRLLASLIPFLLAASAAPADPPSQRSPTMIDDTATQLVDTNGHDSWMPPAEKRDYPNVNLIDSEPTTTITAFMADGPVNTALAKRTSKACKPKTTSMPSCSMRNQDPDEGINSAYCVCNGVTLPLLTPTHVTIATQSCEYTAIPTSGHITTKPHLGPATTDKKMCQVCTPVVNNEDECSSIKNCVVQTGAVTIEAGSSSVHVGTMTGSALYTGISKALESLCPSVTQTKSMTGCSTDTAKVKNVPFVDAGFLAEGTIDVKVGSSAYNVTSLRDAMIRSAALAAMHSASGKNCYSVQYDTEVYRKRDDESWLSGIVPAIFKRDHPYPESHHGTFCNMAAFAGVQYYDPWWRLGPPGPSDYIDVEYSFDSGGGGDFACDLLTGLVDAFAIVQPEFAVGDIELGEAINVICKEHE